VGFKSFKWGRFLQQSWVEVPFHNSVTCNFMVYQDRIKSNLLQLFAHPEPFRMIFYNFGHYF